MAVSILGNTLADAWLADLEHLNNCGREEWNLVTTIADPDPDLIDADLIATVDAQLHAKGKQRVMTVANTIFPEALLRGAVNRKQFYARYLAALSRLRKLKGNGHGTYFGRLIAYPGGAARDGESTNQIEAIITKLRSQLATKGPKRFIYQAQIFASNRDYASVMGFPCLSFVSFQLDGNRLNLTAIYRNQYYFQRALGNFIGLARLQRFVANAAELELGESHRACMPR